MTICTNQNTLIKFFFDSVPGQSPIPADLEIFLRHVSVVELQGRPTFWVTAALTFAALILSYLTCYLLSPPVNNAGIAHILAMPFGTLIFKLSCTLTTWIHVTKYAREREIAQPICSTNWAKNPYYYSGGRTRTYSEQIQSLWIYQLIYSWMFLFPFLHSLHILVISDGSSIVNCFVHSFKIKFDIKSLLSTLRSEVQKRQ